MERYLGVDLGDVRTGVAVSDALGMLASGIGTLHGLNDYELTQKLKAYCAEYGAAAVVMGIPINMDGSFGPRAQKVRAFGDAFAEKTGIRVMYCDERLSTAEAHRLLTDSETFGKKRKNTVDTLSAQIILQSFLDGGCRSYVFAEK